MLPLSPSLAHRCTVVLRMVETVHDTFIAILSHPFTYVEAEYILRNAMRYQPHTWDRNHHVVEQGRWLVRVYQWCIHRYGLSVSPHRANAHLTLDRATPHSFHKHSTGTHPTGEQAALHHCYHSVQERCYGRGLPRSVAKAPTTGCARKYEAIARMQRVH